MPTWTLVEFRLVGTSDVVIASRNPVVGIDLVQMFEQDSPNLEDRLADHVNRRMMRIDHQFALHVIHGGAVVVDDSVTACTSPGQEGCILKDTDDVVILDARRALGSHHHRKDRRFRGQRIDRIGDRQQLRIFEQFGFSAASRLPVRIAILGSLMIFRASHRV